VTAAAPDPQLLAAYRNTDYVVQLPAGEQVLKIGTQAPAFSAVLAAHGCAAAALVTAWNPRSRRVSAAQNAAAQARLVAAIRAAGWPSLPAAARDPAGLWPVEPMRAILGIDRAAAVNLARACEQHALVWVAAGAAPELVLVSAGEA
jgi:hypothetical protein